MSGASVGGLAALRVRVPPADKAILPKNFKSTDMKIETKFNLGDKFYQMREDKPTEFEIVSAEAKIDKNEKRVYYALRYADKYGNASSRGGVREETLGTAYYRTKSALMLATFPDLFKEVKNVWTLNGEGGGQ